MLINELQESIKQKALDVENEILERTQSVSIDDLYKEASKEVQFEVGGPKQVHLVRD